MLDAISRGSWLHRPILPGVMAKGRSSSQVALRRDQDAVTQLSSEHWRWLMRRPADSATRLKRRNKQSQSRKRPATTAWPPISKETSPPRNRAPEKQPQPDRKLLRGTQAHLSEHRQAPLVRRKLPVLRFDCRPSIISRRRRSTFGPARARRSKSVLSPVDRSRLFRRKGRRLSAFVFARRIF